MNEKGKLWDVAVILNQRCGQSTKRASQMACHGRFGAAIQAMYQTRYGEDPETALRTYANGKMGEANVYSPHDIDTWIVQRLMELVAEKPNAGKPAPKTNKGPKTSKGTKRKKGCQ